MEVVDERSEPGDELGVRVREAVCEGKDVEGVCC